MQAMWVHGQRQNQIWMATLDAAWQAVVAAVQARLTASEFADGINRPFARNGHVRGVYIAGWNVKEPG